DSLGSVYVADRDNHRVRQLKLFVAFSAPPVTFSAGYVANTFAGNGSASFSGDGGPATLAGLRSPNSVAVDPTGLIAISDSDNYRVRGVSLSGIITTLAGNGTATFLGDGGPANAATLSKPIAAALDSLGNLYIADYEQHRIRKVDSSGKISTIAGTGTASFSGDAGQAVNAGLNHPSGIVPDGSGNLYIADTDNQRIRKIDPSGFISTIVGDSIAGFYGDNGPAAQARLNYPQGIALDATGNLYIADYGNHRIRKVDSSGTITTVAGNGLTAFSGDGGLATAAGLKNPFSVAVDPSGGYYIADTYHHRIRKVSAAGIISTVAGNGILGFNGDGSPATSKSLNTPGGVFVDASGNLYISDTGNHRVRKVIASGTISTVAGNGTPGFSGDGGLATQAQLNFPFQVAIDGAGRMFIPDYSNNRIRIVSP
ncbi:MAG: NHL repeat-containing protein, partial [Actinomycetota bacterium]